MWPMIALNPGTGPLLVLADASLRSVVLFLGGLLVLLALRIRGAAIRHAVWTVVVCGMLVLPILSLSVPAVPLRLLPAPPPQVALPVQFVSTSVPAVVVANRGLPDWSVAGVAVWLGVALVLFGRMILGYIFARRLFWRGTAVELPCVVADLAGRCRYELREAASIAVPLTLGWLRPVVLLPAGWRNWDHAKLRAVMAHELAHVRRRDWLIMLMTSLNKCVFWFHPLAWWLERRLGALAEEACDDECLLALNNREQYAQALLEMATAVRSGQGRLGWEAMAMARASQVRKRLERLMDETRKVLPGMNRVRWSAAILCAAPVVCGLALLQLSPAQTADTDWSGVPAAASQAPRDRAPVKVRLPARQAASTPAGSKAHTIRAEVARPDDDARTEGTAEMPRRIVRTIMFQKFEGVSVREALDRLKSSDIALGVERPYRPEVVEEARRVLGEMFAERGQPEVRVKVEISDVPPRSIKLVFTAYRP